MQRSSTSEPGLDEASLRGNEYVQRRVMPTVTAKDIGRYVAVSVEDDDFEIGESDLGCVQELLHRHPEAEIFLACIGDVTTIRLRRAR